MPLDVMYLHMPTLKKKIKLRHYLINKKFLSVCQGHRVQEGNTKHGPSFPPDVPLLLISDWYEEMPLVISSKASLPEDLESMTELSEKETLPPSPQKKKGGGKRGEE